MRLWNLDLFILYSQHLAECLAGYQWSVINESMNCPAHCFLGKLHLQIKHEKQGALGPECLKPELPRNQIGNGIKCRVLQFISLLLVLSMKLGQLNVSSTWEKAGHFTWKWPSSHFITTSPKLTQIHSGSYSLPWDLKLSSVW